VRGRLAASEPTIDVVVTAAGIHVTWSSVETVTVKTPWWG
jgi:hypothetical protein